MKQFFEKWVLIPLDIVLIIWAIKEFLSKNWLTGIILIFVSFFVGIIGQSLHKDKTARQLWRGEHLSETNKEK